jgi:hypothetical protein
MNQIPQNLKSTFVLFAQLHIETKHNSEIINTANIIGQEKLNNDYYYMFIFFLFEVAYSAVA